MINRLYSGLVMRGLALIALPGVLSFPPNVRADTLSDIPILGHALHRLGPVAKHGWGSTDVDGDGLTDLVTSSAGPAALILVYGRNSATSTLALKQSLFGPPDSIRAFATASFGETRVVTVSPDHVVTRYGGWPLSPIGSYPLAHETSLVRIGDIDADGNLDLVCAGGGMLSAYNLADGTPKWSMSVQVTDLVLASLDADPALELVIAGGDSAPGLVLDGATRMQDWYRAEGLGTYLAVGMLGGPTRPGIVAAWDWTSLAGFSVVPYAPSWSTGNFDTDGVAAGDTDADGRDEFAVGDGQWGSIRIYDTPTRQLLYEMPNAGHGLWALGMVDLDADGSDEVWYSARSEDSSSFDESFAAAIMNPITARPRLTIESRRHGATASVYADIDQDGRREWIIGTGADRAYFGLLRVLDATSQQEKWRIPLASGASMVAMNYRSLHAAQLDDDPALELVAIGGSDLSDFKLVVIDGVTRQLEHQPELRHATVTNSRLVQHVPGGAPELLVASYLFATTNNVKLQVYSLPAGDLLWSSATVGGTYDRSLGLDVGQLDDDGSTEYLLAHTQGLSAFDGVTGQAEWTIPVVTDGAIIVPTLSGSRILSYTAQGKVTRFNPQTQLADGGFALSAPLERLIRLPGRDDWLLALSGERLKLIDLEGQVLRESGWIGSAPGFGESIDVVRDGGSWLISIGRSFTTFQMRLDDSDDIFLQGFE